MKVDATPAVTANLGEDEVMLVLRAYTGEKLDKLCEAKNSRRLVTRGRKVFYEDIDAIRHETITGLIEAAYKQVVANAKKQEEVASLDAFKKLLARGIPADQAYRDAFGIERVDMSAKAGE